MNLVDIVTKAKEVFATYGPGQIVLAVFVLLFLAACVYGQMRLRKLQKENDDLTEKIKKIAT